MHDEKVLFGPWQYPMMIARTMMRIAWFLKQSGAKHERAQLARRLLTNGRFARVVCGMNKKLASSTPSEMIASGTALRHLTTVKRGGMIANVQETLIDLHKLLDLEINHHPSTSPPTLEHKAMLFDLSVRLCNDYRQLPPIKLHYKVGCPRKAVLEYLALQCRPSVDVVSEAIRKFQEKHGKAGNDDAVKLNRRASNASYPLNQLRHVCTPVFERIVRLCLESDTRLGLQFVMELRSDLQQWMKVVKGQRSTTQAASSDEAAVDGDLDALYKELLQLDLSLSDFLALWFAPGMLYIDRVTYDATPASVIETIAKHEAVHPVTDLDDLKRRLASDRRVFGLFHSLLDKSRFNPVVVLHCSLLQDVPAHMSDLHDKAFTSEQNPMVAAFYSISNLQSQSLAGIGLGEYLIKQAVALLQSEFHGGIETYCTLSPLPGFRSWLQSTVFATGKFAMGDPHRLLQILRHDEDNANPSQHGLVEALAQHLKCTTDECLVRLVEMLTETGHERWNEQPEVVRSAMHRLAARYLLIEKHRNKPLDAVARFHIGNGAELYRINVGADLTPKGWRQSFGCMVNYRYVLEDVHENQRAFEQSHRVATSDDLERELTVGINTTSID
jgi:malonyl-CoA decarboxylase